MLPRSEKIILNFYRTFVEANKYQYSDPERHKQIIDDLYAEEIGRRFNLLADISSSKELVAATMAYISQRESIVDWLVDWCWTADPRNVSLGIPSYIPFIPWPVHVEFIEWVYQQYFKPGSTGGTIVKSRDMGGTWMFCFVFVREWRWVDGFLAGIGSRQLTLVDSKDNPMAIFPKIRTIIDSQPPWWLPEWSDKFDKINNIRHPYNGSVISGQGGDNVGRGDRRSMYLVDEKAYVEHPLLINASLSRTTNCQFDLSTPCGMNEFGQKVHSGKVPVFILDWKDDPRKSQEWYEDQIATFSEVVVAQEVDHDFQASVENLFIHPKWIRAAINLDLPSYGIKSAGLDVAAGGNNKSALAIRKGRCVKVKSYDFPNGVDLTHFVIDQCNKENVDYLNYDPLGVGHSVHSYLERTDRKMSFDFFPVGAGETPSDEFYEEFGRKAKGIFADAVSEWWYNVSVMFHKTYEFVEYGIPHPPEEMISIENNPELITQLAAPLKLWNTKGLIKREPKTLMKSRGIGNLDDADALIMAMISKLIAFNRVWPSYNKQQLKPVNIDWKNLEPGMSEIIIVIVMDKAGGIYGNCFFWGRKSKTLRVYAEIIHPHPIAEVLGNDIRKKAIVPLNRNTNNMPSVSKIYCNEIMNKGAHGWSHVLRKKARIRVHTPTKYEQNAGELMARNMFNRKQIIVDSGLKATNLQYRNWRIKKEKPEPGYPLCETLCIAVSELKQLRLLEPTDTNLKPYSRKKESMRKQLDKSNYADGVKVLNSHGKARTEFDYLTK